MWLINTHNGVKEQGIKPVNIEDYPAIKNHLDKYFPELEKRQDKGDTPYNLRNCAYMEDFFKQKIVWKRIGSNIRFCYDEHGYLTLDSTCFASGSHIKYLTTVLNSKIGNYMLQNSPKTGTGDLLISVQAIEPLRIPIIKNNEETKFNELFDQIFTHHFENENTIEFENELNEMVYELYNLSKQEINFIEREITSITIGF